LHNGILERCDFANGQITLFTKDDFYIRPLFLSISSIAVMQKILLLACSCVFTLAVLAQKKNASFVLPIRRTSSPIKVDGVANEEAWKKVEVAKDFLMVLPMDTSRAAVKTEVAMAYDNTNVYLLAICYNGLPGPYMVESLRRDFSFGNNDNFLVFIDPFEDQTNGFAFGTNAAGAQWDGLMYEGGKVDLNWDNKWTSAVTNDKEKWVLEMAIPFKTLRFKRGIRQWGINFSRNDLKTTEKSSWAPVPRQFPTASLAYTGTLLWDEPPPAQGPNISLIPYVLAGTSKGYTPQSAKNDRHEVGLDAKVGITSSLNLDLTVNPDFSQVEVDKQVTNLDRYELFFPERRQFFLENGDQLNNFGYPSIRPFFSRRIGLGVPIQFGGRLSGKLNRNWRITALDMQTKQQEEQGLPRQNFAVLALQRRVFSRSNINLLFVNRQSLTERSVRSPLATTSYNRNLGIEYNLASSNNLLTGKWMALKSFSPGKKDDEMVHAANLQYAGKRWTIGGAYEYIGKNYSAEVGYVPRKGYIKLNPSIGYLFFPKGGSILTHGPLITSLYFFDHRFRETDFTHSLSYGITFRNKAALSGFLFRDYVQLLFPFDPTNSGKDSLHLGSQHHWNTVGVSFVSKPQSLFTYNLNLRYGGYYAEGKKLTFTTDAGYRFQPYLNLTMSLSYNELSLPKPWGQTAFWLVGPKIDLTLTNKLYFTTYIQYNQQLKNTNINSRLQWRYKPASDLFIVYTDNYLTVPFSIRNRAVLLKYTYWWSL
jgi:hypothetical protein